METPNEPLTLKGDLGCTLLRIIEVYPQKKLMLLVTKSLAVIYLHALFAQHCALPTIH